MNAVTKEIKWLKTQQQNTDHNWLNLAHCNTLLILRSTDLFTTGIFKTSNILIIPFGFGSTYPVLGLYLRYHKNTKI